MARADIIATGILIDLGFTLPTAPGQAAYHSAKFKITKILKGTCEETISVRVVVLNHDDERESPPEKGHDYILFIAKDEDKKEVAFKILASTSEKIAEVNSLITPHPAKGN